MSEQNFNLPLGCACDPQSWQSSKAIRKICGSYFKHILKGFGCRECAHDEKCHQNISEEFSVLRKVSHDMAHMLLSDSDIPCIESRNGLYLALIDDCIAVFCGKCLGVNATHCDRCGGSGLKSPDLYEQECLVFGGPLESRPGENRPDYTEGNPEVDARYPNVVEFINSFF